MIEQMKKIDEKVLLVIERKKRKAYLLDRRLALLSEIEEINNELSSFEGYMVDQSADEAYDVLTEYIRERVKELSDIG